MIDEELIEQYACGNDKAALDAALEVSRILRADLSNREIILIWKRIVDYVYKNDFKAEAIATLDKLALELNKKPQDPRIRTFFERTTETLLIPSNAKGVLRYSKELEKLSRAKSSKTPDEAKDNKERIEIPKYHLASIRNLEHCIMRASALSAKFPSEIIEKEWYAQKAEAAILAAVSNLEEATRTISALKGKDAEGEVDAVLNSLGESGGEYDPIPSCFNNTANALCNSIDALVYFNGPKAKTKLSEMKQAWRTSERITEKIENIFEQGRARIARENRETGL